VTLLNSLFKLLGYGLCRILPIDWVSALGARKGRYSLSTQKKLNLRAAKNLIQMNVAQDHDIIIQSLQQHAGRAALEMLVADRIGQAGLINWLPHSDFDQIVASKRSIVFVTIHMANLGDIAQAAIVQKIPHYQLGFITRKIESSIDYWVANRGRQKTLGNCRGWVLKGTQKLTFRILRELKKPPSSVLFHIDEAKHHQVYCPTFGRHLPNQSNLQHAVRLAKLSGACLVPILLKRQSVQTVRFSLEVLDVFDMSKGDILMTDTSTTDASTADFYEINVIKSVDMLMEQAVLKAPEQWLSLYHLRL